MAHESSIMPNKRFPFSFTWNSHFSWGIVAISCLPSLTVVIFCWGIKSRAATLLTSKQPLIIPSILSTEKRPFADHAAWPCPSCWQEFGKQNFWSQSGLQDSHRPTKTQIWLPGLHWKSATGLHFIKLVPLLYFGEAVFLGPEGERKSRETFFLFHDFYSVFNCFNY